MRIPANTLCGIVVGVCAAAAPGAVAPALTGTRADDSATTVVITMTDSTLEAAPMTASPGTVIFKVVNAGARPRDFEIAGKSTPQIAGGKSATLRVTFPKTGSFLYLSYGPGHSRGLSNAFSIVATCPHPVASTIRVQMKEAPIILSRSTVPCGTVTFVVTNVGKIVHSLQISNPDDYGVVPLGGRGPRIRPGQTVKMSVKFTRRGRAFYHCGEREHGENYSELGYLAVV